MAMLVMELGQKLLLVIETATTTMNLKPMLTMQLTKRINAIEKLFLENRRPVLENLFMNCHEQCGMCYAAYNYFVWHSLGTTIMKFITGIFPHL